MIKVLKLIPLFLAFALTAPRAVLAGDFFGIPDNTVVPKPAKTTPAPAVPPPGSGLAVPPPITGSPANEVAPTLLPDGLQLKTASVGGQREGGRPFRDLGPESGILIGFEYTVGTTPQGATNIESFTPLYLRAAGKARGILRGTPKPGNPATVLEARPGFAVAGMEVRGGDCLDAFRITFMRFENGLLDPSERYTTKWIGGESGEVPKTLRTDARPFVGVYGKADAQINEFGLLVRKELTAPRPPLASITPVPEVPDSPPEMPERPRPRRPTPPIRPPSEVVAATPAPEIVGGLQVFACAGDGFTLFHNGREILTSTSQSRVESGSFPIVKGDVLAGIVTDKSGGDDAWFSLRVVRDGKTILDAGDMRYVTSETLNWKTSRLTTGFRDPKVWTHDKKMGTDLRPRAAWAGIKDASATTLYFKGVVP